MSINKNITFMHISRFILVLKSTSFTFFHVNIHTYHHIFHRRFVYIHTFFHCKIMCHGQLEIYLYNIRHAGCEHRLLHSHIAPPVLISAAFTPTIDKICTWAIRAVTPVLSHVMPPRLYIGIYYWGKICIA